MNLYFLSKLYQDPLPELSKKLESKIKREKMMIVISRWQSPRDKSAFPCRLSVQNCFHTCYIEKSMQWQ